MAWLEPLRGGIVGLDTAPLIYFIEENPTYGNSLDAFFQALDSGEVRAVTSVITLLEVLVHPLRRNNDDLAAQYREILLRASGLVTLSVSQRIAVEAARLRAKHNIRTPDAIQLATALSAGAGFFLTNDSRLPSLPNLEILVLDQLIGTE